MALNTTHIILIIILIWRNNLGKQSILLIVANESKLKSCNHFLRTRISGAVDHSTSLIPPWKWRRTGRRVTTTTEPSLEMFPSQTSLHLKASFFVCPSNTGHKNNLILNQDGARTRRTPPGGSKVRIVLINSHNCLSCLQWTVRTKMVRSKRWCRVRMIAADYPRPPFCFLFLYEREGVSSVQCGA